MSMGIITASGFWVLFVGRIYKQYRIPPLWRRFVAEVLDFMVLLTMKLILVVVSFELTGLL